VSFSFICTGRAVFAQLTVVPSVQTVGSTCSSMRGKQKYSPGGSRIWTLSWDSKSHPSRGIGVSGTTRKVTEVEVPQGQASGWVK
jgi:hypothetical protein